MTLHKISTLLFLATLATACGDGTDGGKNEPAPQPMPSLAAEEIREISASQRNLSVAVSPNGAFVVTGARDGTLRVTSRESGEELYSNNVHTDAITEIVFKNDGSQFLTASYDKSARLWDTISGKEMKVYFSNNALVDVSFSSDETKFVSGHPEGWVRIWNVASGKAEKAIEMGVTSVSPTHRTSPVESVAFSTDPNRIFVGTSYALRHFNVTTGEEVQNFRLANGNEAGAVSEVTVSGDGSKVLGIVQRDKVFVWEISSARVLREFGEATIQPEVAEDWKHITEAVFVNNTQVLALVDKAFHLWDVGTGTELARVDLQNASNVHSDFSASNDGRYVATVQDTGAVKLLEITGAEGMMAIR